MKLSVQAAVLPDVHLVPRGIALSARLFLVSLKEHLTSPSRDVGFAFLHKDGQDNHDCFSASELPGLTSVASADFLLQLDCSWQECVSELFYFRIVAL